MKKTIFCVMLLIPVLVIGQATIQKQLSDVSSRLDVICKNEQIMIPRAALKSRIDKSTIVGRDTKFILVYNSTKNAHIVPGYYFWYNSKWNNLKNLAEENGVPKSNGMPGDLFLDFSTRDVYFYNGSIWVTMNAQDEILTDVAFENQKGILQYKNTEGEQIRINLSEILPNFEKPKTVSLNEAKETLSYIDKNGEQTVLNLKMLQDKSKKITASY